MSLMGVEHQTWILVSVAVCLAYVAGQYVFGVMTMIVSVFEHRERTRQDRAENYGSLATSRFTIPVSILSAAYNEVDAVVPAVKSLLGQTYSELEVIIVNDGSTDGTLQALREAFDLEPRHVFYRKLLETEPVRGVYRSSIEPRLTVIDKENGGKADALNCGFNFARYRYVCCVDGDTVYARDAVLKGMRPAQLDPAHVVGVASFLGVSQQPSLATGRRELETGGRRLDPNTFMNFQHLDLMRSFLLHRLAWSRLGAMMCVPGGFALWRRDVISEAGGFSKKFSCEDIEMTFRIHERNRTSDRNFRILSLPEPVAETEGPQRVGDLIKQRARWQRVLAETVWHYRHMVFRRGQGIVGWVALPYLVLYEAVAPLFQAVSFLAFAIVAGLGLLDWDAQLWFFGVLVFANAIPVTVSVLLHDQTYRDFRWRDVVKLVLLGPFDLIFYRPILLVAGMRGTWDFLRGKKGWDKFERNASVACAP